LRSTFTYPARRGAARCDVTLEVDDVGAEAVDPRVHHTENPATNDDHLRRHHQILAVLVTSCPVASDDSFGRAEDVTIATPRGKVRGPEERDIGA
jgi:hypothetical protein